MLFFDIAGPQMNASDLYLDGHKITIYSAEKFQPKICSDTFV